MKMKLVPACHGICGTYHVSVLVLGGKLVGARKRVLKNIAKAASELCKINISPSDSVEAECSTNPPILQTTIDINIERDRCLT